MTTLLGYLAALARTRGDAALAAWHDGWERRLRALEDRGRAAAAAMAADPEAAIAPADEGTLGRAGAKLGAAVGHAGRGDRQFADRSPGPPPRNLKECAP